MQAQRLVSPFNWLLIALVALVTASGFVLVPLDGDLPIHWGISGAADGFAPTPVALLMPLVILGAVLALLYVMRRARLRADFTAGRFVIDAAISGLAGLSLVLAVATVLIGTGAEVDMPRIVCLAVTALFVIIGNALPKTRPNGVAGIRLPWTLRDADNWRVTHRWTGRVMFVCGVIAFAVIAIGVPVWGLIVAVFGAAFVPVLVGLGVSYAHALRHRTAAD